MAFDDISRKGVFNIATASPGCKKMSGSIGDGGESQWIDRFQARIHDMCWADDNQSLYVSAFREDITCSIRRSRVSRSSTCSGTPTRAPWTSSTARTTSS